jgi:hypothetical protein
LDARDISDISGLWGVKLAESEHLKRLLGGFLELVSNFIEASKKFKI